MRFLVILAVLAAAGYYFFLRPKPDVQVVGSGAEQALVLHQGDGQAEYALGEEYEESFMLFGANDKPGNFAHAWFSALTTRHAAFLLRQYPDLYECKSAGAKEAQATLKRFEIVGRDAALRDRAVAAAKLYEERFAAKGDRVCFRVTGRRLTLRSAELGGAAFNMQKPPDWFVVLANELEILDCRAIVSG